MSKIEIHKNSITNLTVDAIVNAANSSLAQGSGVCGAIFAAAGPAELAAECAKYGHCHTGDAVITSACKMRPNVKYIIHAVGPRYFGGNHGEPEKLSSCYFKSLELAKANNCHSIAFPLISAGKFHYPLDRAWDIALSTCTHFLEENSDYDILISIVTSNMEVYTKGLEIRFKFYD